MKRLTMVLAAAVIFAAVGCEKKTDRPEEISRFDAEIDGPVCVLTVGRNENLLKDQEKLAREAETVVPEEPPPTEPSPTTSPTTLPTTPTTSPGPASGPT